MKNYLLLSLLFVWMCFTAACAGFSRQPVFTDIVGTVIKPVKLVKTERTENNILRLYFTGQANLLNIEIFMPKTEKTVACTTENSEVSEKPLDSDTLTVFSVSSTEPIGIGEHFVLRGSVSDGAHSVLDFALPFQGANTRPARLRMTEIRPLYGSKPKSEFIEFIVTEGGNLAGITITNVGDKKNPDYCFPVAEVEKGEVIVYHWRSVEDGIKDEITKKMVSGGTQACTKARDFWGPFKSIPKRNANVILIQTCSGGEIQDAILYCTEKELQKMENKLSWNNEILDQAASAATASGIWQGKPDLSDAVINKITASKSLVRNTKNSTNNAKVWLLRDSKAVTMGQVD